MKVMVYLCAEHAERIESKTIIPMTDDVLICQVPTCFKLATWKYFAEVKEGAGRLTKKTPPIAQDVGEMPERTASEVQEPDSTIAAETPSGDAPPAPAEAPRTPPRRDPAPNDP